MHTSCLALERVRGQLEVWFLWRGLSAPLPLVGRGAAGALPSCRHILPLCVQCKHGPCVGRGIGASRPAQDPPHEGHRMHTSCLALERVRGQPAVWFLWHGLSAPLPLVGRGEGWGESLSVWQSIHSFRTASPLQSLQEKCSFSKPCRLRAPHPLPLPTRGRGGGRRLPEKQTPHCGQCPDMSVNPRTPAWGGELTGRDEQPFPKP